MNLNSRRESLTSLPISVASSPRTMETARSMESQDHNMPDLVTDGGGGGGVSGPATVVPTANDRESPDYNHVDTLVDSFNQVYQKEIAYYDQNLDEVEAMRLKENTYKRWISDFSEHNRVLVASIAELEYETERRLELLERKLRDERSGLAAQKILRLENDVRALVKIIKRTQAEGVCRSEGIQLQDTQLNDILNSSNNLLLTPDMNVKLCVRMPNNECEEQMISIPMSRMALAQENSNNNNKVVGSPRRVAANPVPSSNPNHPMQRRQQSSMMATNNMPINHTNYPKPANPNPIPAKPVPLRHAAAASSSFMNNPSRLPIPQTYRVPDNQSRLRSNQHLVYQQHARQGFISVEPVESDEDVWRRRCEKLKRDNHDLNKQLLDNRVLVVEVAEKHDQILRLKTEVNQLEENLRQANMQTHFKDDVIKELRRECRNLLSPHAAEQKRSVSVCLLPKSNELEVPRSREEERQEMKKDEHTRFLKDLAIVLEILEGQNDDSDPLEIRILNGVKVLKAISIDLQEERDVLRNNNLEMESKLGALFADNIELNRANQKAKHDELRNMESMRAHLIHLRRTTTNMVTSEADCSSAPNAAPSVEDDDDEDFIVTDANRVLYDANQMLIDLKNEIDKKNALIQSNGIVVEQLKEEVAKNSTLLDSVKKSFKEELFDKDKLIIDLENSIRNHNNRIEDLEVEKLQLENQVIALRETVKESSASDPLQAITSHRNQLEIECANQKTTISNLKEALENLKRESKSLDCNNNETNSLEVEILGDLLRQFFTENLSLDQKVDLLRDENLGLRSKLFHTFCGNYGEDGEEEEDADQEIVDGPQFHRRRTTSKAVPRRATESVGRSENVSSSGIGSMPGSGFIIGGVTSHPSETRFRPTSSSPHHLNHFRRHPSSSVSNSCSLSPHNIRSHRTSEALNCESCSDESIRLTKEAKEEQVREKMEKKCNEKLNEQRMKYDQLLSELTSDLEILTSHLSSQPDLSAASEQDTRPLENSIHELEEQNDRLQKSIVSYEGQLKVSESEMMNVSQEGNGLRRKLAELEYQQRSKETLIEELRSTEASLREELKLQRQICKCHYDASLENQDALSLRLQEMHRLLSEKSAETVRSATAMRWKDIELERLGKLGGEEKQRLHDEINELMKRLGEAKNRVQDLERTVENRNLEVSKLSQRLEDNAQKEGDLQASLMRNLNQMTNLENELFKDKSLIRELSDELDRSRIDGRERETRIINDLTKTRTHAKELKDQLYQREEKLSGKIAENESLRAENEVYSKECKSLREDNMKLRGETAAMEGRCESLTETLKCNKFEMNALQHEINRLTALEDIRENNRIFIKQNQDIMARYDELQKQHQLMKEQYRILLESKEQLQISIETSKIWQKEYTEREEIINGTLLKQNDHIKSLLEERKSLLVKTNELENELIITTNTLDQYREKLGTTTTDEFPDYNATENLMYEEEGNYDNSNQQANLIRYGSDPELRELNSPLQYLSRVQQLVKQTYRTGRNWKDDLKRQLSDDFYLL